MWLILIRHVCHDIPFCSKLEAVICPSNVVYTFMAQEELFFKILIPCVELQKIIRLASKFAKQHSCVSMIDLKISELTTLISQWVLYLNAQSVETLILPYPFRNGNFSLVLTSSFKWAWGLSNRMRTIWIRKYKIGHIPNCSLFLFFLN